MSSHSLSHRRGLVLDSCRGDEGGGVGLVGAMAGMGVGSREGSAWDGPKLEGNSAVPGYTPGVGEDGLSGDFSQLDMMNGLAAMDSITGV